MNFIRCIAILLLIIAGLSSITLMSRNKVALTKVNISLFVTSILSLLGLGYVAGIFPPL